MFLIGVAESATDWAWAEIPSVNTTKETKICNMIRCRKYTLQPLNANEKEFGLDSKPD
jgi:hypothetical protein